MAVKTISTRLASVGPSGSAESTFRPVRRADRSPGLFDGALALDAARVRVPAPFSSAASPLPDVAAADGSSGLMPTDATHGDSGKPSRPAPSKLGPRSREPRSLHQAPPIPQAARDLLADAGRGLGRAMRASDAADRYAAAHLAALRAAAAVLAARAKPVRGRRGSAWELISRVAPEFSEWAAFFAAGSAKRQAAEAGLQRMVTARDADDMVRQVGAFLDLVEDALSTGPRQIQRRAF